MNDNVIQFPVVNKRYDLSNIAVEPEEIAEKIRLMKMAYFSGVADEMVDDTLRSMTMLNLEDSPLDTNPIDSKDIILLKESIISTLCRIIGIYHPLHEVIDENIIVSSIEEGDLDEAYFKYKFKNDANAVDTDQDETIDNS